MTKTPAPLRRSLAALLITTLTLSTALANVDPKKGRITENPKAGNYTFDQEIQLGRQAVPEIEKQLPILPADHPTSKYINALGQKLAAKAPGYKFPYSFRVVNQKEINAFALPGGPIYMNVGTIQAASEAELAGVLGHEISHVVMRHSARQAAKAAKAQVPLAILSGVLGMGVGGWVGQLAQMGLSIGAGSVFMVSPNCGFGKLWVIAPPAFDKSVILSEAKDPLPLKIDPKPKQEFPSDRLSRRHSRHKKLSPRKPHVSLPDLADSAAFATWRASSPNQALSLPNSFSQPCRP